MCVHWVMKQKLVHESVQKGKKVSSSGIEMISKIFLLAFYSPNRVPLCYTFW